MQAANDGRGRLYGQGSEHSRLLCVAFNKDRMLSAVDQLTGSGREAGFSRLRIMGNMDWVFDDPQASLNLIQYEAEVNQVLERNRQPAICVYNMAKLSGAMLMDLLRTHPMTLINGVVQDIPFFTPPSDMIEEIKRRRSHEEKALERLRAERHSSVDGNGR